MFRACVMACLLGWTSVASAAPADDVVNVTGLGAVTIYAPTGPPQQMVLFLSGDGGWNKGVVAMAERLRANGALVAGIDIRPLMKALDTSASCGYPSGQLEELARSIQLHRRMAEYKRPILVGYSSGASLVYAMLAASPPETFAGGISLGFCPNVEIHRNLCQMRGLVTTKTPKHLGFDFTPWSGLPVPWIVLQGEVDQVCSPARTKAFTSATGHTELVSLPSVGHGFGVPRNWDAAFVRAYRTIADTRTAAEPPSAATPVADLSPVEVPAAPGTKPSDTLAIVLTGDGGWADIDKSLAAGFAARGIPAVGWSSLRYYWTPRTPDAAAADLERLLRYYLTAWRKDKAIIVGYSFGADTAPFLAARLPADLSGRIRAIGLLGLSESATFEFHVTSWLGVANSDHYPTAPEVRRLSAPVICVRGEDETESGCARLSGSHVSVEAVGRGHHFSGEYGRIVDLILGRSS